MLQFQFLNTIRLHCSVVEMIDPIRIDNKEAALLFDDRTDLVSTNRLGHGWTYQKLANQQAIFRAGCKAGCDFGCD